MDWQVPGRGEECRACGKSFEADEWVTAYLRPAPDGYERIDQCAACDPPVDPAAIGQWKTRWANRSQDKPPQFDREGLFDLFRRLESDEHAEQVRLRFVLSLLLWRKKIIKLSETIADEDGELWRFITPRAGDRFNVRRPNLTEAELEELSQQLETLLSIRAADPS